MLTIAVRNVNEESPEVQIEVLHQLMLQGQGDEAVMTQHYLAVLKLENNE